MKSPFGSPRFPIVTVSCRKTGLSSSIACCAVSLRPTPGSKKSSPPSRITSAPGVPGVMTTFAPPTSRPFERRAVESRLIHLRALLSTASRTSTFPASSSRRRETFPILNPRVSTSAPSPRSSALATLK